jgi:menaquinol-cytochrome c reductase iron-sulfur subunit
MPGDLPAVPYWKRATMANPTGKSSMPRGESGAGHAATPRRNFLVEIAAIAVGGVISLFPLATGLVVFFSPLLRKRGGGGAGYVRIATLDAVPSSGRPQQFPVVADVADAWTFAPNENVGAVYLMRRKEEGGSEKVVAYNAICPHAGCFFGYDAARAVFQCPCHTSAFETTGKRIEPSPSPRDLDELEIDHERLAADKEVWVKFVNYYPGKHERIPKG